MDFNPRRITCRALMGGSDVIVGGFVEVSNGWMLTSLWKAHEHFRKT
jgi:hypothetical protein